MGKRTLVTEKPSKKMLARATYKIPDDMKEQGYKFVCIKEEGKFGGEAVLACYNPEQIKELKAEMKNRGDEEEEEEEDSGEKATPTKRSTRKKAAKKKTTKKKAAKKKASKKSSRKTAKKKTRKRK